MVVYGSSASYRLSDTGILSVYGSGSLPQYSSWGSCPWYSKVKDITEIIISGKIDTLQHNNFGACTNVTKITILDGVKNLILSPFANCTSLTSIKIPSSVSNISYLSFQGCNKLENIEVASDNNNYCSNDGVLFSKDMSRLVICPSGLKNYNIPNGVKIIGDCAFYGSTIENVIIPDSVTDVNTDAFEYCRNLKNIIIPSSVKSLGNYVFDGCSNLEIAEIHNNNVGSCQFMGCTNLKKVLFSENLTRISNSAFASCEKLNTVKYKDIEYNSLSEFQAALDADGVQYKTDSFKNTGLAD